MVVPFPAGGLTDVPARLAATMLQEKIGQRVVIENRTGGSGTVGAAYAARATPDGYTLFANSLADTQNLHYLPVTYSPVDDFAEIGWIVDGPPLVLVINAELPFKTLAEFIADAKANPNNTASAPPARRRRRDWPGAAQQGRAGTKSRRCPIAARAMRRRAAAGGAIQGAFTFYSQAKPLADDGKVRALAVAAPKRIAGWPDVPTFTEQGYNIDSARLRRACSAGQDAEADRRVPQQGVSTTVVQSDEFKKRMAVLGMAPPPADENTPEKFDKFMREEIARQGELAELSGQKLKPAQK